LVVGNLQFFVLSFRFLVLSFGSSAPWVQQKLLRPFDFAPEPPTFGGNGLL